MTANLLTLNSSKTEFLLIGLKQQLAKISSCSQLTLLVTLSSFLMNTSPFLTRYQLFLNPATHISVNFAASDYISITIQPVPLPPPSCTPSLTTAIYFTKPTQLNRLQHIQNSLARAVVRAIKSFHINPALKSLHWLKIRQRIDYKILSLAYKVLTNTLIYIILSLFILIVALVLQMS